MNVIDLFCGTGRSTKSFRDRGHFVSGYDIKDYGQEYTIDVFKIKTLGKVDFLWSSCPCEGFSIAAIGKSWYRSTLPKSLTAGIGLALLGKTLELIEQSKPTFWVIENPVGMMRNVPALNDFSISRNTITFCAYGEPRRKPTDLFGVFPKSWRPRPMCSNGDECHEAAPRGSKTGTQGLRSTEERASIPYDLGLELCVAAEKDLCSVQGALSE